MAHSSTAARPELLSPTVEFVVGLLLGGIAIVWLGYSLLLCLGGSDGPAWNGSLLLALPGLMPAIAAWVFVTRASLPDPGGHSTQSVAPEDAGEHQVDPVGRSRSVGRLVGAMVLVLAACLQCGLTLLMTETHFDAGGITVFLCRMVPGLMCALLAGWTMHRSHTQEIDQGRAASSRRGLGAAAFLLAIVCVVSETAWYLAGTFLYTIFFAPTPGRDASFIREGLAILLGPSLILLGLAAWLMYGAFRITTHSSPRAPVS